MHRRLVAQHSKSLVRLPALEDAEVQEIDVFDDSHGHFPAVVATAYIDCSAPSTAENA